VEEENIGNDSGLDSFGRTSADTIKTESVLPKLMLGRERKGGVGCSLHASAHKTAIRLRSCSPDGRAETNELREEVDRPSAE
jgi:hypothetical protein